MKILVALYKNKRVNFWTLAFSLVAVLGVYMYSLNVAVMNVVKRGVIEKQIVATNNSITDLESKYISLKKKINIELAYSLGYKEIETTTYIPIKSVSVARASRAAE